MWLDDVLQRGPLPILEKTAAFSEARHQVLSENIANIDTPGYKTKVLDPKLFQAKLRQAIEARPADASGPLPLESTSQFRTDEQGMLHTTPDVKSPENILFHDGTNSSVEREMANLAENTLMHQVVIELMRQRFNLLHQSIVGRL